MKQLSSKKIIYELLISEVRHSSVYSVGRQNITKYHNFAYQLAVGCRNKPQLVARSLFDPLKNYLLNQLYQSCVNKPMRKL